MAPTPSRNNGWSSTLKTRMQLAFAYLPPCFRRTAIVGCQLRAVNGNGNTHFCRRNCLAPNIESRADMFHPLTHPEKVCIVFWPTGTRRSVRRGSIPSLRIL